MALLLNAGDTVSRSYSYTQPSPLHPSQPQGTGERTGNLCEKVEAPLSQYRIYIENFKSIIDNYSTFTLKFNTQLSYSGNTLYLYTGSNTALGYITGTRTITKTFNLNAENKEAIKNATNPYIFIYVNNVDQSSNTNAMLVSGSTALPYEPYGVKIPILNSSQTTNIYLGEAESTRRIKKLVLDGTENWVLDTQDANRTVCHIRLSGVSGNYGYCTHIYWKSQYQTTEYDRIVWNTSSGGVLYISLSNGYLTGQTVADFKAYLAAQYAAGTPVTIWYVLATETTGIVNEPLRKIGTYADEVSGITIPTIAGANTISVDTTLQPNEVTVNYKGWHPVADVHERENGQWD